MKITPLDTKQTNKCQFVEDLYIYAFPKNERRSVYKMYELYNTTSKFNINILEDGNVYIGLITHWDFDQFVYIEHFAISDNYRNSGLGAKTLSAFKNKLAQRPLILEVELGDNELSKRRIGFYQRQGFVLWDQVPYVQPPYNEGYDNLPMHLMSTPNIDVAQNEKHIIKTLHEQVYGVKNNYTR